MLVTQVLAPLLALATLAHAAPTPDPDPASVPVNVVDGLSRRVRLPDSVWCSKKQINYCKNVACPGLGMDYDSCYWLGSCNCRPRPGGGGGCRRGHNVVC